MNEDVKDQETCLEFVFDLDDPPQKVWRAVTIPELRERWLPQEALAVPDAIAAAPDQEVSYRLRDDSPPFFESTVTFTITPNATGGTCLRVVHELTDPGANRVTMPTANRNGSPILLAA